MIQFDQNVDLGWAMQVAPLDRLQTTKLPGRRAVKGVKISGMGSYVPERVVTNSELAYLGCDDEWIVKRTGIRQRHYASPEQDTSDLATEAAKRCLESAGVSPNDVDMIIVASTTPDYIAPSTSALVQGKLGATNAAALDVNAGCTGFVHALITGCHFIASGCYQRLLVIGAETLSRKPDPQDPRSLPLLGDGAGATLLTADDPHGNASGSSQSGIINYLMGADGTQGHLITMSKNNAELKDTYLKMEGRTVFKWAIEQIPAAIQQTLDVAGLSPNDIDLFVLHQANGRIIDAARDRFDVSADRFFTNLDRVGNTSTASIPLALDEARRAKLIDRNSRVVMCGFGAGLNWSTCVFQGIDV